MTTDPSVSMTVNGKRCDVRVEPDSLLLDALRYQCGLTGTKLGCGTGDCGACTVILDGHAVNSCLVYALECEQRTVETIEGVTKQGIGAIITEEMVWADAVQCGFCTPGVVVSAYALLERTDPGTPLTESEIKEALAGNLCRCTGYMPILKAIINASERPR